MFILSRSKNILVLFSTLLILVGLFSCDQLQGQSNAPSGIKDLVTDFENPPVYGYRVLQSFPHDCNAFTQGLVYDDGELFEGTGLRGGESSLRRVELETGEVLQQINLDNDLFGEGITTWEDQIFQITWQSRQGFVYDRESFDLVREFTYSNVQNEGWGITHDGEQLIMSDGSSWLYFLDPNGFELDPEAGDGELETITELHRVNVIDQEQNRNIVSLNELEYINGLVFANVWRTELIAVIDPETGFVGAWIYLEGLAPDSVPDDCPAFDVLNGIAYDASGDRLFVTGKQWDELHQIAIVSGN